jgi:hypothetical protein
VNVWPLSLDPDFNARTGLPPWKRSYVPAANKAYISKANLHGRRRSQRRRPIIRPGNNRARPRSLGDELRSSTIWPGMYENAPKMILMTSSYGGRIIDCITGRCAPNQQYCLPSYACRTRIKILTAACTVFAHDNPFVQCLSPFGKHRRQQTV